MELGLELAELGLELELARARARARAGVRVSYLHHCLQLAYRAKSLPNTHFNLFLSVMHGAGAGQLGLGLMP